MTWQRHKGTNTLPPRWTSGRWTIYRTETRDQQIYWTLWDTEARQWHDDHPRLATAQLRAEWLEKTRKPTNAATAP